MLELLLDFEASFWLSHSARNLDIFLFANGEFCKTEVLGPMWEIHLGLMSKKGKYVEVKSRGMSVLVAWDLLTHLHVSHSTGLE